LAASGQKAEILETLDRASDQGISRALAIHLR
jgi:hypothetical protein